MLLIIAICFLINLNPICGKYMNDQKSNIMNIVKDYSLQEKITSCVFYSKDTSWRMTLKKALKEGAFCQYMGFDTINEKNTFSWPHTRTSKALHIYDDDNIDRLNLLLGKQNSVEALATVGKQNSSSEAIWFVHIPFADESYVENIFRRTPLRLDSLVFAIVQDNSIYNIYDIYKIDENSEAVQTVKYAQWDANNGFDILEPNIWKRRSNLKGHHLRMVATVSPPFQTYLEDGCNSSRCFKGVYADTFHKLAETMNFTFTIEWVKAFGGIKNGSWTGMIGLLKGGKKDMGASAFIMKQSRATAVDYLPTLMTVYTQLFIKNPAESYDWLAYTKPLKWDSWISILIFCAVLPFIMLPTMIDWNDEISNDSSSLNKCYVLVYKSLLLLGVSSPPRKTRKQITFLSVTIASMLLYYLWEAMLISYFSTPLKFQSFNSLEEFLSKTDKKLYVVKGTAYEYTFRNADETTKQRIWNERMEPYMNDMPTNKKDLLPALMNDENLVVYGNALSQKSYNLYKNCDVIALPKKYVITQMGYTIPKNSSFTSAFTYFINQFIESGTVERFKKIYKAEDQVCPTYEGKPVGIEKCFSLFGILSFGGGLSLVWFFMELTLPETWFSTINTAGQRLSATILRGSKNSLNSNDFDPKKFESDEYIKKLQDMTQTQLIKRILNLEEYQVA